MFVSDISDVGKMWVGFYVCFMSYLPILDQYICFLLTAAVPHCEIKF